MLKLQAILISKQLFLNGLTRLLTSFILAPVLLAVCSAHAEELPDASRSLAANSGAQAIISSVSEVSPGRYRITGTVVDTNNKPACGLALASGKCMFSCGPGSPRCEGGTDSLSFGGFDLTNLPAESNGTIIVQTFVSGILPGRQTINPKGGNNP